MSAGNPVVVHDGVVLKRHRGRVCWIRLRLQNLSRIRAQDGFSTGLRVDLAIGQRGALCSPRHIVPPGFLWRPMHRVIQQARHIMLDELLDGDHVGGRRFGRQPLAARAFGAPLRVRNNRSVRELLVWKLPLYSAAVG